MTRLVGTLLKGFGPAGGSVSPPNSVSLAFTDNGGGSVTATVSGSSSGATNNIYAWGANGVGWVAVGSIVGNGDVVIAMQPGRYFVYCKSTKNGLSVISQVYTLFVTGSNDGLDDSPARILQYAMLAYGAGIVTHPDDLAEPTDNTAWPIYCDTEPNSPDNCVTVYNTSGNKDGRSHIDGRTFEHYGVQIRVRGQTPSVGYAKANAFAQAVDKRIYRDSVVIGSHEYLVQSVTRTGGVLALGTQPGTQRKLYTLNTLVSVRQQH